MELQNRTIICTVLFLDIVEYSRKPVAEQMKLRDRFNVLLCAALEGVAANDRVILDTGDGAAVTFLGEPEAAVLMALRLREAIAAELLPPEHQLSLRSGINLGPVKLVKDINARPNIIGDGINVAQRIMGFAQPGQLLVARSYFEVVSRLSDEYSSLFQYDGSRTDKHVREHEVYTVTSGDRRSVRALGGSGWKAALRRLTPTLVRLADRLPASPLASTVVAMLAILAVGVGMRATREVPDARFAERAPIGVRGAAFDFSALPPPAAGAPGAHAPALLPAAIVEIAALPTIPPPALPPPAEPAPKKVLAQRRAESRARAPEVRQAQEAVKVVEVAAAPPPAAPKEELVRISVAAFPWGEIYVNGAQHGVTPPVQSIQVRPGRHEIEIRNTTFPSHRATLDVGLNDRIMIRHRFQPVESR